MHIFNLGDTVVVRESYVTTFRILYTSADPNKPRRVEQVRSVLEGLRVEADHSQWICVEGLPEMSGAFFEPAIAAEPKLRIDVVKPGVRGKDRLDRISDEHD